MQEENQPQTNSKEQIIPDKKVDETTSNLALPKAGMNILTTFIILTSICTAVKYKKYNYTKGIK